MAIGISSVKQYTGADKTVNYEVTVNLHLIKTNEEIPKMIQGKLEPYELLSMYGYLKIYYGLILSKYWEIGTPDGGSTSWKTGTQKKFDSLKDSLNLKKIGAMAQEGEENRIKAYFEVLDLYESLLSDLNKTGLTPPDEEIDAWPSYAPKTIQDEDYKLQEGDLDYKIKYPIPSPSEGASLP